MLGLVLAQHTTLATLSISHFEDISAVVKPWTAESMGSLCFRHIIAYNTVVTEHTRGPGKIIYLGACLIAAVRLAREERWDSSPRVISRISDAIQLATRIYERMKNDFGHDFGS